MDARLDLRSSQNEAFIFRVAGTYLRTVNLTPSSYFEKELPYSTPLRLIGHVAYELRGVGNIAAIYTFRARRYTDFANNSSGLLPSVATLDIHVRTPAIALSGLTVEPHLAAINLTNEHFEEVLNFPLPGRIVKLSFEFTYDPN
jgi:hypothetical protein